jgi:saccharopine dehydrogenase (NAD+, L-lysine-forming)
MRCGAQNLPALVPREASIAFSADLLPHLGSVGASAPWQRCRQTFHRELACAG